MTMKVGEWVRFWTKNWPPDITEIQFEVTDGCAGKPSDVTGKGLYSGRGKIVRVQDSRLLVREERSDRLVELSPEDRVEPMATEYSELTLGDLRKFLEAHKAAPDDVPIAVDLPVRFNCDEEGLNWLKGHPEAHDPNEFYVVPACGIRFSALELNSSEITDVFVPQEQRKPGEVWEFTIEITPSGKEAHVALRGEDHD